MASFQAKMGRDRLRMREKKYSRSDPFQHDPEYREFQKNSKKMQKIKKTLLWLYFDPERDGIG